MFIQIFKEAVNYTLFPGVGCFLNELNNTYLQDPYYWANIEVAANVNTIKESWKICILNVIEDVN